VCAGPPGTENGRQAFAGPLQVVAAAANLVLSSGKSRAGAQFVDDLVTVLLVGSAFGRVLVEQNARMALSVCDRGYIREKGHESPVTHEKLGG
jgi:hypothetical protein